MSDMLSRAEVARVLAESMRRDNDALRNDPQSKMVASVSRIRTLELVVALEVSPEFESALKALEKEQDRG